MFLSLTRNKGVILDKNLEIYIHVPFCVRKCRYCDFLSGSFSDEVKEQYVNALVNEICASASRYRDYTVKTLFMGGGTPSILTTEHIKKIMAAVRNNYNLAPYVESTIECNPGTLNASKIDAYLDNGFNRMSIGLQSANNEELKALGRIHTTEEFLDSYLLARNYGFTNINVDLMSAIMYQTVDSFVGTLESVASLKPEHMSVYSLIVEENTPLYDWVYKEGNENTLPSEEDEREMYYKTKEILGKYGYERYEISNYARKGYECRHNVGYWQRENYVGFGAGAASLVNNIRFNNVDDIHAYIARYIEYSNIGLNDDACKEKDFQNNNANEFATKYLADKTNVETLSQNDCMSEFMFLGLRMIKGISKTDFFNCFGKTFDEVYGNVASGLIKDGLLLDDGENIKLTEYGIDISNRVMAEFLLD